MTKKPENGPAVPIGLTPSPITVVAKPMDKEPVKFDYDITTPSGEIVQHLTKKLGMNLEPAEYEIITETLERSRNLFIRGIDFAFAIRGKSFKFKIPPRFEKKL